MLIVARLNIGGVALNVAQTAQALQAQDGIEVILVNGQIGADEGDMQYLLDDANLTQIVLPALGRELSPLKDLRTVWQLWRLMRHYRPDVVHTHTAKAGFVGRWAAYLAGVERRLHSFHGHVFSGYFSPRKTQIFLNLERLSAHISTQIITLSPALKQELAEVYKVAPAHKISVIPLGLNLAAFINPSAALDLHHLYDFPEGAPIIAVIGRIVPIKNHYLFIAAADLALQKRPDLRFLIVGDGELRAELEREINRRGLQDIIKITGWQTDIAALMPALSLVTITSDNEGTPVSLIEALAAGCPIISTDVGGVRDLLGAFAQNLLVPPNHPQALSKAWLNTLENPPDLRALQTRVVQTYSIEATTQALLDLYRS